MSFWKNLGLTAGLTTAAATVGTLATDPNTRWYKALDTPTWQPPNWLFPVAWTGLYASIAASSADVLTRLDASPRPSEGQARTRYLQALGTNLVLNAGWSVLFWKGRNNVVSTVEAAALAVSSADLARRAAQVSPAAGAGLAPYAAWTAFATALTGEIARRNG